VAGEGESRGANTGPGAGLCTGGRHNTGISNQVIQHRYVVEATAVYADGTTQPDAWTDPTPFVTSCGPAYFTLVRSAP
jgi:hypothetical protein